jgi:RimJ/RimL family protein N-acetyltransferase
MGEAADQIERHQLVRGWVNVEIERSRDFALLSRIATSHEIYRPTSDDFSPLPEQWKVAERDDFIYLVAAIDRCVLGFCAFYPVNGVSYEAHLCFLSRGAVNQQAFKKMLAWMWEHTRARRISGAIPAYNRGAIAFVKRIGFEQFGVNPQSWMKGAKLYAQVLLGISRPGV